MIKTVDTQFWLHLELNHYSLMGWVLSQKDEPVEVARLKNLMYLK